MASGGRGDPRPHVRKCSGVILECGEEPGSFLAWRAVSFQEKYRVTENVNEKLKKKLWVFSNFFFCFVCP